MALTIQELKTLVDAKLISEDKAKEILQQMMAPQVVVDTSKITAVDWGTVPGQLLTSGDPNARWAPREYSAYDKLKMRLHMGEGDTFGFDWCHIYEGPTKTFIFIVLGNEAVILEDDTVMYPSDRLLAAFHLTRESMIEKQPGNLTVAGKP